MKKKNANQRLKSLMKKKAAIKMKKKLKIILKGKKSLKIQKKMMKMKLI